MHDITNRGAIILKDCKDDNAENINWQRKKVMN